MSTFKFAVLPGDGIGPEVMKAALEVLDVACKKQRIIPAIYSGITAFSTVSSSGSNTVLPFFRLSADNGRNHRTRDSCDIME